MILVCNYLSDTCLYLYTFSVSFTRLMWGTGSIGNVSERKNLFCHSWLFWEFRTLKLSSQAFWTHAHTHTHSRIFVGPASKDCTGVCILFTGVLFTMSWRTTSEAQILLLDLLLICIAINCTAVEGQHMLILQDTTITSSTTHQNSEVSTSVIEIIHV